MEQLETKPEANTAPAPQPQEKIKEQDRTLMGQAIMELSGVRTFRTGPSFA